MTISITPLSDTFAAEIRGVDLRKPVAEADLAAVQAAFDAVFDAFNRHSVVVIGDQDITPEDHIAFSRRFGKLMTHVLKEDLLDGPKDQVERTCLFTG